ncbi:hypothetical protein CERZMDRAFT_97938 [Cercospora zeae-maydis SCOH1-5]|uniref:Transcription factor domain-containing protein n=1 Tax=Cercospora zeae-maydis SCOH1-5 TaxID=717836 RepID=A0A6A6FF53_9PEZI|nr:hypothetical protein CERZMDRAFT_97938 [Cercospora zeae-maydis SCOH1-5]
MFDEDYVTRAEARNMSLHEISKHTDEDNMDLTFRTISKLVEDHLKHIHPLQPFLQRSRVTSLFELFRGTYASDATGTSCGTNIEYDLERPRKRRRTTSPSLLVSALGAAATQDRVLPQSSPANTMPVITPPGCSYYLAASEIIATQIDGYDLVHAHMFMLAGMYKEQIGRTAESASWYSMAGRVLQHLSRRGVESNSSSEILAVVKQHAAGLQRWRMQLHPLLR